MRKSIALLLSITLLAGCTPQSSYSKDTLDEMFPTSGQEVEQATEETPPIELNSKVGEIVPVAFVQHNTGNVYEVAIRNSSGSIKWIKLLDNYDLSAVKLTDDKESYLIMESTKDSTFGRDVYQLFVSTNQELYGGKWTETRRRGGKYTYTVQLESNIISGPDKKEVTN